MYLLPHLDYCSVVWQECSAVLAKKLERVQNYGMRLILSKSPRTHSEELREELGWKTLTRRNMVLVHRCVVGRASASLCDRVAIINHVTRGINKLLLRRPNSNFFKKSFSFWGAQDWNSLPNHMRTISSALTLRTHVKTIM